MMTEEEARTKWCPMSRYAFGNNDVAANRWKQSAPPEEPHALNPVPCRCIASACMAWRWDLQWASAVEEGQGNDLVLRLKRLKGEPKLGRCGIAGQP